MSRYHSYHRARQYRTSPLTESTIFILEIVILAIMAGVTWVVRNDNFFGAAFFGTGGVIAGLMIGATFAMIYTTDNGKQEFHVLGLLLVVGYILGIIVNYIYQFGSWIYNAVLYGGTFPVIIGVIVGLFVFFELALSVVDAKAQNMV